MLINREKLIMFQNLSLIHIDIPVGPAICYKLKIKKSKVNPLFVSK